MSESNFVRHVPCEECGSSDAGAEYDDGHTHCFACGVTRGDPGDTPSISNVAKHGLIEGSFKALTARGITEETCRKWGYKVGRYKGRPVHVATYSPAGSPVAQKIRFPDKDFTFLGKPKEAGLYGMQLWRDGGKKLVITEGEIDALSVSQLQGNKWPVISVPNGAQGAKKDLAKHIEYLETFEEIILMFDMDEPGRKASFECAELFTPGKCKIASLPLKDANECLLAGRGAEVIAAIWDAKTYRPEGILTGQELKGSARLRATRGLPYPWKGLTEATYGIRQHEIITLLAGSGMGKTEVWKEFAYHLIGQKKKVGLVFLEEIPEHTWRCMIGKKIGKRIHLPDVEFDDAEVEDAEDFTAPYLEVFDHRGVSDFEVIAAKIRYWVHSGVQYIFVDHITAMAEGKGEDNINSRIHYIMEEINKLTQNLPVTVFLISHLKKSDGKPAEEGGRVTLDMAYGSGAIKQRSNFVFALERNQQADSEEDRHRSTFRILKDRYTGMGAGKTIKLHYNTDSGRLLEETLFDDTTKGDF